ncbi:MAG: hypothetical protein ACRDRS_05590 [Pseudonocardiaceae bacterium]
MRDRASTMRSRELGAGLRQAMEGADLNGKQAARVLGWPESSRSVTSRRSWCPACCRPATTPAR